MCGDLPDERLGPGRLSRSRRSGHQDVLPAANRLPHELDVVPSLQQPYQLAAQGVVSVQTMLRTIEDALLSQFFQ